MAFRLRSAERGFYPLFSRAGDNILAATADLARMVAAERGARAGLARRVKEAELAGDGLTHDILVMLNSTFVTPFDREDIHALISALDDVLDYIEEAADTFILYRIEAPSAVAIQQAAIIVKQCEQLQEALANLRGFKGLEKYWIEVHRLENEGDQLARKAIAGLFSDGGHPIEIIKWKDVYAHLEAAIDKCEDVANIIERITIKHA